MGGNGRAEEGTDGGEREGKAPAPFSHSRFSPLAFPFLRFSPGLFHLDLKTLALYYVKDDSVLIP